MKLKLLMRIGDGLPMKRKTLSFFVALSILLIASAASAANFVEVERGDVAISYVDINSIESRSEWSTRDYVVAWVKLVPKGKYLSDLREDSGEDVDYILCFYAFNLRAKQSQLLSQIVYDIDGAVIYQNSWNFNSISYKEIAPDTLNESIYLFVMEQFQMPKKKKVIPRDEP